MKKSKTKLISIEYDTKMNWSWGLIAGGIFKGMPDILFSRIDLVEWRNRNREGDIILSQNVTQLPHIKELDKTIARLGGNRSFDEVPISQLKIHLTNLHKCPVIIATNKKLQNIASIVNPNTYLIQNGLDLDTWKFKQRSIPTNRKLRVGFVGNISSSQKRAYKGYDIIKTACNKMGITLCEALYKSKQIPHDEMQKKFYSEIDLLILLTDGEGSSNTIMECLACGLPVITTKDAGFHGEFCTNNENIIICEKNTQELIISIANLIADPEHFKSISVNARKFAEEHHDAKEIAKKYTEIIKKHFIDNSPIENTDPFTYDKLDDAIQYIDDTRTKPYKTSGRVCKPFKSYTGTNTSNENKNASDMLKTANTQAYNSKKVTIACVYRSGGDYNEKYVEKLKNAVSRNCSFPFEFICLSNEPLEIEGVAVIPLKDELPGWWSKVELFRPGIFKTKNVLFFDLDTVIVGDITAICKANFGFAALKPWSKAEINKRHFCSGIMGWANGNYDFLYTEFYKNIMKKYRGDQDYFSASLLEHKLGHDYIQEAFYGVYSYKIECRIRFPKDARIVVFHGIPRPNQVGHLPFMKKHWI